MRFKAVLLISLLATMLWGQESSEYRLKAAFIERFTRFITWPVNKPLRTPVVLGVWGDGRMFVEMKTFFETVKIQSHPVEVRNVLPGSSLDQYDIIMIGTGQNVSVTELLKRVAYKPVITVGDTPAMGEQGVMFSFTVTNGKLRFLINSGELERAGFKVSSILLNSATIVTTGGVSR